MLGTRDNGLVKNIEKWPLIASHGIHELGRGFFSMRHKLTDLGNRINLVYRSHDKHSLKRLINVTASRLVVIKYIQKLEWSFGCSSWVDYRY